MPRGGSPSSWETLVNMEVSLCCGSSGEGGAGQVSTPHPPRGDWAGLDGCTVGSRRTGQCVGPTLDQLPQA